MPWLRLLRAGALFSPAADVVAGACLAGLPWSWDLGRAAIASVLVYGAGMVLNDHADREEDSRQRPERPIPSGDVGASAALVFGTLLLAAALATSPVPLWHGGLIAGVLAYDYLLKRNPLTAALTMGSLRAANLSVGAIGLAAAAPTDLILMAAAVYGIYIICVTILGGYEDQPSVTPRAVASVQSIPPVAAFLLILQLPDRTVAASIGGVLAFLFLWRVRRIGSAWSQAAIRGSMTWLLLGTTVYTGLLCLGSGRWPEAVGIAVATLLARRIAKFIALT